MTRPASLRQTPVTVTTAPPSSSYDWPIKSRFEFLCGSVFFRRNGSVICLAFIRTSLGVDAPILRLLKRQRSCSNLRGCGNHDRPQLSPDEQLGKSKLTFEAIIR